MIKKIKNLKYSQSKNQEEIKWVELIAKRNRLLLESDWTQLADVKLTEESKHQWSNWRESLRQLSRFSVETVKEYKAKLDSLIKERDLLFIDYSKTGTIKEFESGKHYLHQLLVEYYNERINFKFTPNIEEKYQETLDIVAIILSKHEEPIELTDMNMDQLKGLMSSMDNIEMDVSKFPFFELTMRLKNFTVNETILYLLDMKDQQYNFSLQEEYNLIHYEHRIESCDTVEDLLITKREIDMNYGH